MGIELTHKQTENRLTDIKEELERLDAKAGDDVLEERDQTYWNELTAESAELRKHKAKLERQADLQRASMLEGDRPAGGTVERGDSDAVDRALPDSVPSRRFRDPWDLSEIRGGLSPEQYGTELRSRALSAVEVMPETTDKRREAMTRLIERWDDPEQGSRISQLALASSDERYVRAFGKIMRNMGNLGALSHDEQASISRAMSLTSNAGGYLVPFQLDPTVILTADGSFNEVRRISKQVVATGNTWNGVTSGGSTGSWDNEATEVSDDTATYGGPQITICKLQVFVPISLEAALDEVNVASAVTEQIAFEVDLRESIAFVTGSGTNQPQGIITALSGGSSSVNTTTADTFGLVDLYALDEGLPARFRFNASWLAHRKTYNKIRQFDTSGGAALWEYLGNGQPGQLLGKPVAEAEAMDSTASGTNKKFLVFGDFGRNYVIADRIGTVVEYVPQLFGASGRPTGQRGWFAYKRVGADSVNDGAFRFLNGQ